MTVSRRRGEPSMHMWWFLLGFRDAQLQFQAPGLPHGYLLLATRTRQLPPSPQMPLKLFNLTTTRTQRPGNMNSLNKNAAVQIAVDTQPDRNQIADQSTFVTMAWREGEPQSEGFSIGLHFGATSDLISDTGYPILTTSCSSNHCKKQVFVRIEPNYNSTGTHGNQTNSL